jgi:hypothetical protein
MPTIVTIDFETLGLNPLTAPMLEMGYTVGNTDTGKVLSTSRFIIPEVYNKRANRVADFDTIQWWMEQANKNPELYTYITELLTRSKMQNNPSIQGLKEGLRDFFVLLDRYEVSQLWCTDKNFDFLLLQQLMVSLGLGGYPANLTYKDIYETRWFSEKGFVSAFTQAKETKELIHHTAQDDSLWLFNAVCTILDVGVVEDTSADHAG